MKVQEVEEKITTRIAGLEDQETRLHDWLDCIRQVGDIAEKMGYNRPKSQGEEGSLMQAFEEMVEQSGVDDSPLLTAGSSVETMDEEVAEKQPEPDDPREAHYDRGQEVESVTVEAVQERSEEPEEIHESADEGMLDQLRTALASPSDEVDEEAEAVTVEAVQERSEEPEEIHESADEGMLDQLRTALASPSDEVDEEAEAVTVEAVQERSEEPEEIHESPEEGMLDQLRTALTSPTDEVDQEAEAVTVEAVQERSEEPEEGREMPDEGNLDQLRESLNRPKDEKKAKKRFGGFMSSFFAAEEE